LSKRFKKRLLWGKGVPREFNSEAVWKQPLKWDAMARKNHTRTRVFVASMADVFDAEVPSSWRDALWDLVRDCTALDFQILTKRPMNIPAMLPPDWEDGWPHVWLGTTVEDQLRADERTPLLQAVPARLRFLSCEPLLESVTLDLNGIHWVICGGESGALSRPMEPQWARFLRDQCIAESVPFHFKQWGGRQPKIAGRILDGRTWDQFPATRG